MNPASAENTESGKTGKTETETKPNHNPKTRTVLIVPGRPLPLQRHRCVKATNRMYDPSAAAKKQFLRLCVARCAPPALAGPLAVRLRFRMPRPKSHFRTGKFSRVLRSDAPKFHTRTPDVDNLAKFVLDALNGTFYVDDAQIVQLDAAKDYASAEDCASDHEAARAGATHIEITQIAPGPTQGQTQGQTTQGQTQGQSRNSCELEELRELEEWAAGRDEPPSNGDEADDIDNGNGNNNKGNGDGARSGSSSSSSSSSEVVLV